MRSLAIAGVALALAGCVDDDGSSSSSSKPQVDAADFRFDPATVRVKPGATVVWRNTGATVHTVKGDGFFSRALSPGERYERVFPATGVYPYLCTLHPAMKGRIEVR